MGALQIVAVGEVLWDFLPQGRKLGGAPANFAYFTHALGAESLLISRVGDDPLGDETLERLEALGLSTAGVTRDPEHETGKATVQLDAAGVAQFTIHEPAAWDFLQPAATYFEAAERADAVCFGTLGQRAEASRYTIREIVSRTAPGVLRVLDLNLRAPFYSRELILESIELATVLKLNEDELQIVGDMLRLSGSERDRLQQLQRQCELETVILTKGGAGSVLFQMDQYTAVAALPTEIVDTVGAGDSFTAAAVIGLLQKLPLEEVHARASKIAAFVCTQPGATPAVPRELLQ